MPLRALTVLSTETSIKTLMVYEFTLGAFCTVKQAHFVASSRSFSVHLLFIDCICLIKCWVLDSFYLNDVLGAGLAKPITDFVVLAGVPCGIQLEEMYSFFSSIGIGWLGNPIFWKLDIWQEEKQESFLVSKHKTTLIFPTLLKLVLELYVVKF